MRIFIGHDSREPEATKVCVSSIQRVSREPNDIYPLRESAIRRTHMYCRAPKPGTWIDSRDGRPFSTEFTFTRFLVPFYCLFDGWALFCDSDFLFLEDPNELMAFADPKYAVMCVEHDYHPSSGTKMDGREQQYYPKKGASSLVLWNCSHPGHDRLSISDVNEKPGRWLHRFGWLEDHEVGMLPPEWNWLSRPGYAVEPAKAVHFTEGIPSMEGYEDCPYADEWRRELAHVTRGG